MPLSTKPTSPLRQRLSGLEVPRSLRALVRAREWGLILLAGIIGASESHAPRRYAEELELRRKELVAG